MFVKLCSCTIFALLATGSSFGAARLFSSHQYPPPQTTPLYRLISRQYWPSSWSTQYGGYQQSPSAMSEYEPLPSSYQPASYPMSNSADSSPDNAYKSNLQSEDFMSILELAVRQRYNPESLATSSYSSQQQQQQDSDYVHLFVPHTQTKQHHHTYRGAPSINLERDEAANGEYPHQLEPIVYESHSSTLSGQQHASDGGATEKLSEPQTSDLSIYNSATQSS